MFCCKEKVSATRKQITTTVAVDRGGVDCRMKDQIKFFALSAVFHGLCLSGLMWQVSQISVNYFKFEIVSDIKVIIPESVLGKKSLNFCFRNHELAKQDRLNAIRKLYTSTSESTSEEIKNIVRFNFTIKEQFDISIHERDIFEDNVNVTKFLTLFYICYQLENVNDTIQHYKMNQSYFKNTSFFFVSASRRLPRNGLESSSSYHGHLWWITLENDRGPFKLVPDQQATVAVHRIVFELQICRVR